MFRAFRPIAKKFFLQHTFQRVQVRKDYEILNNVTPYCGKGISGIKSSPGFYPSGTPPPLLRRIGPLLRPLRLKKTESIPQIYKTS